ncbi:MAG: BrnT family toxin [Bryobacteraceae bacterium]|nr:BrnT family toxin [Bryobacteraceae bacterium]
MFEWDPRKAAGNARKHGVQFADAVLALDDERGITMQDGAHGEERWITVGIDALARILTIVYTWREDTIRIISARPATPNERRHYLENS